MNDKTIWGLAGVAFASAALLTIPAQAADLGGSSYKEPTAYAASTWAGSYVGGHLGAAWTSGSADLATAHWHTNEGNEELRFDGYGSGHKDSRRNVVPGRRARRPQLAAGRICLRP